MFKCYKQWINSKIEIYKTEDKTYEQMLFFAEECFKIPQSLQNQADIHQGMNLVVSEFIDDFKSMDKQHISHLEAIKVYIKNFTF